MTKAGWLKSAVLVSLFLACVPASSKAESGEQKGASGILSGYCAESSFFGIVWLPGLGGPYAPSCSTGFPFQGLPMGSDGTLRNMSVASFGSVNGVVLTVYVNGAATSISCVLPDSPVPASSNPPPGSPTNACSDLTHTVQVKAGDQVGIGISANAIGQFRFLRASLEKGVGTGESSENQENK